MSTTETDRQRDAATPGEGPGPDPEAAQEFLGRVVEDAGAAVSVLLTHLGDRLGLYAALADRVPVTAAELAARTGAHPRIVHEWLCNQAAGGYLRHEAGGDRFLLPPEHAAVLAAEDSPFLAQGLVDVVVALSQSVERQLEALRAGTGLGWDAQHPDLFSAVDRCFRPSYEAFLVDAWVAALPGLHERLSEGARIADVGCGHGTTSILLAQAYPRSTVVGHDLHAPSVERAREAARRAGMAGRVSFEVTDAAELTGSYDLVLMCDSWHDTADPVGAARAARESLTADGWLMLVEPRAGDRLEDNLTPMGRLSYGISTLACTPCSVSGGGPGLGAQAGEARTRELFAAAGFGRFVRAAETPLHLVYAAQPGRGAGPAGGTRQIRPR